METRRAFVCTLVAVAVLAVAAGPARAVEDTTGTVTIETMSIAAGLGYAWGKGVLDYRGQQYPFTIKSFSVADVGVARREAKGEVYNLKNVEDFEGTFMAAIAGAAIGGGAGAAAMHNQNDVDMVWTGTNQGLIFSLAHAGVHVKFTDEARALAAKTRAQPAAAPRPSR